MSGAYVAKPDAEITVDFPPGWNGRWQFPGPWPPGYDPQLTLVISAPSTIAANATSLEVSVLLLDHGNYPTDMPTTDSLTWSIV